MKMYSSIRKSHKDFKKDGGYLWNHDQVRLYREISKKLTYRKRKFPHIKWSESKYLEQRDL